MSGRVLGFVVVSFVLTASAQEVWFCPLDPLVRTGYGGSPQYMSLFATNAPWAQAKARVKVFKIYPKWIDEATDADLKTQIAALQNAGIALALEYGVLSSSAQCGSGVEGFGGEGLVNAARRIKQNGGTLRYLAMDEPIYFATMYTGANACHWTVDQMAASAAPNLKALMAQFPALAVGDIEPVSAASGNWLAQYQAGIESFRKAMGSPIAFFHADVLWDAPTYLTDLAALRKMLASEGVRSGIIYNGGVSDNSDAQWVQSAARHMVASELSQGSPDMVIFQSWNGYPQKLLPETDSDSFTSLINTYFRRKTMLHASAAASLVAGTLAAADTGAPIAGAAVTIAASPQSSIAGLLPPGATSIIFGLRINAECNCSGSANLLLSSFSIDTGAADPIVRDFSNPWQAWNLTASGTGPPSVGIEGVNLRIRAQPGQAVVLNSDPIALPPAVSYLFRVNAQAASDSSGSGYFALIFLNNTVEIARALIPISGGGIFSTQAATDNQGHYAVVLPTTGIDPVQIQSSYTGSDEDWPASTTIAWPATQPPTITAIVNAASFKTAVVCPGEIVVLFGTGLGPANLTGGSYVNQRLTTTIGGITVRFDGIPAPLVYVSDKQTAAIVPYGINLTSTIVTVSTDSGQSLPFPVGVAASSPGLFTSNSSGGGLLAALNSDGSLNAINRPASPGQPIAVFGTGAGQTSPEGVDGLIMNTKATPLLQPVVTVGDQPATVEYFGSAPGEVAGVFQLNFRIPVTAPRGDAVPVNLTIGTAGIAQSVMIAVH